jgi:hypothetical protein
VLAGGVLRDVEVVRDGVRAVGEGERDVDIRTGARDEIAELAGAANRRPASSPSATPPMAPGAT